MSLREFAWIGGVIGAIAMVVSVLFASIQIRNNTRAIRAAAFQQMAAMTASNYDDLARDANLCSLILRGGDDFASLDRLEKARFRFYQMSFLQRVENAYFQEKVGTLKAEHAAGIRATIDVLFSLPGQRDAWALVRGRINPEFRAYVDVAVAKAATTDAEAPKSKPTISV